MFLRDVAVDKSARAGTPSCCVIKEEMQGYTRLG